MLNGLVAVAVVALVPGIADGVAAEGPKARTDGGSFKAATALVANDAADRRTTKSSDHGALLSGWASGAGGEGERRDSEEGCECCFHSAFG